jgi:hypothetical protein
VTVNLNVNAMGAGNVVIHFASEICKGIASSIECSRVDNLREGVACYYCF